LQGASPTAITLAEILSLDTVCADEEERSEECEIEPDVFFNFYLYFAAPVSGDAPVSR
jgi:hypothetical protein